MSSHHIVREAQEPALLILQPRFLTSPHMAPLLEWSPTIVVVGEVLPEVVDSGIKIDAAIFAEEQAEEVEELLKEQMPVELVSVSAQAVASQENPLLEALAFLAKGRQQAVNVLVESVFENDSLLQVLAEQELLPGVVLLDGEVKAALCRSGKFTKWFPAGEVIKVLPANQKLTLTTNGFLENTVDAKVQGEQIFRTGNAGVVTINSGQSFWLVEQLR